MKRREGRLSFGSFCFIWSNWIAAAIAFAVQLPSWPWSYTAGHLDVRSSRRGSVAKRGAA